MYVIDSASIFIDVHYFTVLSYIVSVFTYPQLGHRNTCHHCCQAQRWEQRTEQVFLLWINRIQQCESVFWNRWALNTGKTLLDFLPISWTSYVQHFLLFERCYDVGFSRLLWKKQSCLLKQRVQCGNLWQHYWCFKPDLNEYVGLYCSFLFQCAILLPPVTDTTS